MFNITLIYILNVIRWSSCTLFHLVQWTFFERCSSSYLSKEGNIARTYNYFPPTADVYLLEVDFGRKWQGMKLDTHGVGVLIRVSRSSRVSRIGRWYGMHGSREASDRRQPERCSGSDADGTKSWLHFPQIALSHSVYIRSVNAFVHATGCRNTLHRGFLLPLDVWIYVLPHYEDR